jgi:hypothetical protein
LRLIVQLSFPPASQVPGGAGARSCQQASIFCMAWRGGAQLTRNVGQGEAFRDHVAALGGKLPRQPRVLGGL